MGLPTQEQSHEQTEPGARAGGAREAQARARRVADHGLAADLHLTVSTRGSVVLANPIMNVHIKTFGIWTSQLYGIMSL